MASDDCNLRRRLPRREASPLSLHSLPHLPRFRTKRLGEHDGTARQRIRAASEALRGAAQGKMRRGEAATLAAD